MLRNLKKNDFAEMHTRLLIYSSTTLISDSASFMQKFSFLIVITDTIHTAVSVIVSVTTFPPVSFFWNRYQYM